MPVHSTCNFLSGLTSKYNSGLNVPKLECPHKTRDTFQGMDANLIKLQLLGPVGGLEASKDCPLKAERLWVRFWLVSIAKSFFVRSISS